MSMTDKNITKKIILYLINQLGDKIEGKKKLMKLMFLIEHYDFSKKKLVLEGSLGNTFRIYYYGVFSLEVMECFNELVHEGHIIDGFPLKSKEKSELEEKEIKEKVGKVISEFGEDLGYDLEVKTLKMMGIKPYEKKEYFGKSVAEIIKNKT